MRRTALTLAGLFAAVAAALSSCGRNTSVLTGPSNLVSVKVMAPPTIAPGSTAQLSALATYTDGSSKDVTMAVQWHSSAAFTVSGVSQSMTQPRSGTTTPRRAMTTSTHGESLGWPGVVLLVTRLDARPCQGDTA
jgi:hypothetical protein